MSPTPSGAQALTDDRVFELIEESGREFRRMKSGVRGQQMVPSDDPLYVLVKVVERAIRALAPASPAVRAGWKLVPEVLTEDMHAAAVRTIVRCNGNDEFPPRVWRAMLAASPPAAADRALAVCGAPTAPQVPEYWFSEELSGQLPANTALQRFVQDNEPADGEMTKEFREGLQAVIDEVWFAALTQPAIAPVLGDGGIASVDEAGESSGGSTGAADGGQK